MEHKDVKDKPRLSSDERTARLAARARKQGTSPTRETPAPKVAALDTTPQRQHIDLHQQEPDQGSSSQAPSNAELQQQLEQQQRLIKLLLEKRKEEADDRNTAGTTTGFKTPNPPKAKDIEYARLVEMSTEKTTAPQTTPTMENFLDALTKSLTTAPSIRTAPRADQIGMPDFPMVGKCVHLF